MRTDEPASTLTAALDALTGLAGPADCEAIARLRDRLAGQRLRVLVAGEAKRGKSTLVNALLARPLLPAGVTPLTALATTVRYGSREAVTATYLDGRTDKLLLPALDELVTERGNPGNKRKLADVTVTVDAPLLRLGIELVDTPGTGSVYGHNTDQAQAALASMDAAVFVLSADPPVSANERDLIGQVAGLSVALFVVLNKADRVDDGDLPEVMAFTARVAAEAAGRPVRVYPLSARAALLDDQDARFSEFMTDFRAYLDTRRTGDLQRSVSRHAWRIASGLRDEACVERHVLRMHGSEAAGQIHQFSDRLAAVRGRRSEAADIAGAQSRRILAELNAAAERASRESPGRVGGMLDDFLASELRAATAAKIERTGRERLARLAVDEAERWRREQVTVIETSLDALLARLDGDLMSELAAVRDSAAELLGLDLAVAAQPQELRPDLTFFYTAAEDPGQVELLAGTARRLLPGEAGRDRARDHLRRQAASLVPRQIGRARADLQYRLAETTRQLVRAVEAQYGEATGRLEKAVTRATRTRDATEQETSARHRELAATLTALDHILCQLKPGI